MKRSIIILLLNCLHVGVFAQGGVIPPNVRAVNTLERLTDSNGLGNNEMMYGIPLPEGKVIGDTYLSTDWKRSIILLYDKDKLLEGYPIRYDIKADELDVKGPNGIKVLSGRNVKSFIWIDSSRKEPYYFVNAKEFNEEGVPLIGFFEVMVDGLSPLFKKINISVKKADYNVTLSMGSRDDKILKSPVYYISEGKKIFEIPGNRKKFLALLKTNAPLVETFMDSHDLSTKKEEDLVQIFKYLNSLNNN